MITPEVETIIRQIPDWSNAKIMMVEPLRGLTNTNYSIIVDDEQFVLRVGGKNTERLGIDRKFEFEALSAASKAGIGAQVMHFVLPEGHLVTRFIKGRHYTLDVYRKRETLQRIVEVIKHLHSLPPIRATFSPFRRIKEFTHHARELHVQFPHDFDRLMEKMREIENEQGRDHSNWQRFCHNDLFYVNILDDGNVRLIDWEFAGVGDIYFDLATLCYGYDSIDTLSHELETFVLECYFREVSPKNWARLEGMKYMVMFFNAMWAMLQEGLQREGLVLEIDGFNFQEYAWKTFETMRMALSDL